MNRRAHRKRGRERAEARRGPRAPCDPRAELALERLVLHTGDIEFVHPRRRAEMMWEAAAKGEEFPPYWAELWLSGQELAYAVSWMSLAGSSVLELGCGLGLPSIAAARAGARVLATDRSPDALELATVNASRNAVGLETLQCSWAEPDDLVPRGPWDLVLASDVLYDGRGADNLLELLTRLVDDDSQVWIADPRRAPAAEFLREARTRWGLVSSRGTREPAVKIHRLGRPF